MLILLAAVHLEIRRDAPGARGLQAPVRDFREGAIEGGDNRGRRGSMSRALNACRASLTSTVELQSRG
jgi:hypothetical protein